MAILLVLLAGTWTSESSAWPFTGTYFGGGRGEGGYRLPVVLDDGDNIWIVGCTDSSDLPVSSSAVQSDYRGRGDLFVAKLSPAADRVLACTYLGNLGEDGEWAGASLALGGDGSVFVAATTSSAGLTTSVDAWSARRLGETDLYIARLSSDLSEILAATYLGGSRGESHVSIAVDGDSLLVVGSTRSSRFPSLLDSTLPRGAQVGDVFVCRLDTDLTTIIERLVIRGSGDDTVESICLGSNGSLFLAGWTSSTDLTMPDGGAFQTPCGGNYDGFVLRVTANLDTPIAGTYLGGSSSDFVYGMDRSETELWVGGHTASRDLPASANAIQTTHSGGSAGQGDDGFVMRLSLNFDHVTACTYYGGVGWESIVGLRVWDEGVAWIGGTTSPNLLLDSDPFDVTTAGFGTSYVIEGFVCVADEALRSIQMASYLGGSGIDSPGGLAFDTANGLWIAGATTSEDLLLDGFATEYHGGAWRREGGLWGGDLFLIRIPLNEVTSGQ